MTSTMKSEPSGRVALADSSGVPVSAAATTADRGDADGLAQVRLVRWRMWRHWRRRRRHGACGATGDRNAARNLRRSTCPCLSSRDIVAPFLVMAHRWAGAIATSVLIRRLALLWVGAGHCFSPACSVQGKPGARLAVAFRPAEIAIDLFFENGISLAFPAGQAPSLLEKSERRFFSTPSRLIQSD